MKYILLPIDHNLPKKNSLQAGKTYMLLVNNIRTIWHGPHSIENLDYTHDYKELYRTIHDFTGVYRTIRDYEGLCRMHDYTTSL